MNNHTIVTQNSLVVAHHHVTQRSVTLFQYFFDLFLTNWINNLLHLQHLQYILFIFVFLFPLNNITSATI